VGNSHIPVGITAIAEIEHRHQLITIALEIFTQYPVGKDKQIATFHTHFTSFFCLSHLDTITVQAPHPPSPHPNFVPVNLTA